MLLPHKHDMKKMQQPAGRAVGFFNSYQSRKAVKYYLPLIEQCTEMPAEVKVKTTSAAKLKRNKRWRKIATDAHLNGERHVIKGRCAGCDGEGVAIEIKQILNQAYQSPLYKEEDEFRGSVHYIEGRGIVTYVKYPVPKNWFV